MNLKEALKRIEELETELEQARDDLDIKTRRLGEKIDEYEELERENEALEKLEEGAALFRDPSNWNGNKFEPVLTYLRGEEPYNLI